MSLKVAVQMDPIASINIAGDSTFALMLSAQARGHELFHYAAEDLSYADGRVWTMADPVSVQRVKGDHRGVAGLHAVDHPAADPDRNAREVRLSAGEAAPE